MRERDREAKCESALYQLCLDPLNMGRFSLEEPQSDHHIRKSRWLHVGTYTTDSHDYRGEPLNLSQQKYTAWLNVCGQWTLLTIHQFELVEHLIQAFHQILELGYRDSPSFSNKNIGNVEGE